MTSHGSTDDILRAYSALSDGELLALRHAARRYIDGTRFSEPLDLVHEALSLSLDGRRNWPTHIDFGLFMAMTMRSIADADRKRHENALSTRASAEDLIEMAPHWAGSHPSVEDELIVAQDALAASSAVDMAMAGLEGDEDAKNVIHGMMAGLSPRDIRSSFQMSAKSFDSAKHRAMRKIKNAGRLQ